MAFKSFYRNSDTQSAVWEKPLWTKLSKQLGFRMMEQFSVFYTFSFDNIYSALLCCNKRNQPNDILMTYASLVSTLRLLSTTIFACNSLHFVIPDERTINECYLTYARGVLMAAGWAGKTTTSNGQCTVYCSFEICVYVSVRPHFPCVRRVLYVCFFESAISSASLWLCTKLCCSLIKHFVQTDSEHVNRCVHGLKAYTESLCCWRFIFKV